MPQDSDSRDLDKVIVRLPDGMRDRLKDAAAANNRSMNAEIVARLEHSFDPGADWTTRDYLAIVQVLLARVKDNKPEEIAAVIADLNKITQIEK